jgi:hypothetical protein
VSYALTDDPNDPCTYDVQWMSPDGSDWPSQFEDAVPYIAPGVEATRLYKYVHDACESAVIAYSSDTNP